MSTLKSRSSSRPVFTASVSINAYKFEGQCNIFLGCRGKGLIIPHVTAQSPAEPDISDIFWVPIFGYAKGTAPHLSLRPESSFEIFIFADLFRLLYIALV